MGCARVQEKEKISFSARSCCPFVEKLLYSAVYVYRGCPLFGSVPYFLFISVLLVCENKLTFTIWPLVYRKSKIHDRTT